MQRINISSSIGIALYPDHGDDALQLYKYADQAMYRAKEQGRNQTQIFQAPEPSPTFAENTHSSA